MFHLLANYGSLAAGPSQVPAIATEQIFARNATPNYLMPYDMQAFGLYALGGLLLRVQVQNPFLRIIQAPYINPINGTAANRIFEQVQDLRDYPIPYKSTEEIVYSATNSGAGPTDTTVFTWLRQTHVPAPRGTYYTLRLTSTTASVASAWTDITTTNDFNLPAGKYAVIGGVYYGATALAFRCIFDGGFFRPGGLGFATEGLTPTPLQINGNSGLWGYFDLNTIPRIQVFNGAVVAVHTIYLQCVKVA